MLPNRTVKLIALGADPSGRRHPARHRRGVRGDRPLQRDPAAVSARGRRHPPRVHSGRDGLPRGGRDDRARRPGRLALDRPTGIAPATPARAGTRPRRPGATQWHSPRWPHSSATAGASDRAGRRRARFCRAARSAESPSAPRRVEAAHARNGVVFDNLTSGLLETRAHRIEVADDKRWMCLGRRAEVRINAEVNVDRTCAVYEPAATERQARRPVNFNQAEQRAVEATGLALPPAGIASWKWSMPP